MSRLALGVVSLLVAVTVGTAAAPTNHRLLLADELADLLLESTARNEPGDDDLDPDTEAAIAVPDAKSITTLVRESGPPEATTHDQVTGVIWAS